MNKTIVYHCNKFTTKIRLLINITTQHYAKKVNKFCLQIWVWIQYQIRKKKTAWYLKCSIRYGFISYMDYIWTSLMYSYLLVLDKITRYLERDSGSLVIQTDLGHWKIISPFDIFILFLRWTIYSCELLFTSILCLKC